MKIYNEPFIELIALSPMDIIQNSGDDPFLLNLWNKNDELPGLKTLE